MIYSVDFDGTLCSNRFPEIGEPNLNLIQFLINQRHIEIIEETYVTHCMPLPKPPEVEE